MNAALVLLLASFVGLAILGIRRKRPEWMMVGMWGGLAALQTATGVLQFTAYQREGWSLLLATGCLGGLGIAWFWSLFPSGRWLVVLGMAVAVGVTLAHPPSHYLSNSTAEETLVHLASSLRAYPRMPPDSASLPTGWIDFLEDHLDKETPLSLITRHLMQDQLLSAVAGPNDRLWFSKWDIYLDPACGLNQSAQSLVFIDRPDSLEVAQLGSFAGISPVAARNFMQQQRLSYGFNDTLESHLRSLPTYEWSVVRYDADDHLRLYVVSRLSGPEECP